MQREVVVGHYRVSLQAEPKCEGDEPGRVTGYSVRYTLARTDGAPVRPGFPTVSSYELNVGTDLFPTVEAALDHGLVKARDDIATVDAQQQASRNAAANQR
ncbi:hypothetical protein [Cupriavidus necator]|uniref:hypothetical protein n=1 Tax=Cupriavidus necator TaxID=106590 RepID=UPI00339D7069